ncbi:flagellar hook-associated protein FlgL [Pseudoxanthomonas composti]|uniref:Flagellar hook-associated protein FlgL n=1 Tax=Pseudoxanthomonas composti TaxID=2137479 RepID=A0A4Q1JU04_9GAMM|nr:flagellar hook-associated protein FlgL [Pseudoxanthomonas composti]RXR02673.1 flagellar hook-associated protein FlgL [Pseudoxanthomonas composti]
MTSRISTGQMFTQSLSTMLTRQKDLQHLQQQLATGKKIVTAADNPVSAGNAVTLDRAVAKLEQFDLNGNTVQNRLNLQESVLTQVGDQLARVKELTLQANTDTLSDTDRNAIALELKTIQESLLGLANAQDGAGRYLFGGASDANAPFSRSSGTTIYNGDQTQKQVEIAPDMFVTDSKPGSEVFIRIRTGTSGVDAGAAAGNAGTGVIADYNRSNAGGWNGGSYSVVFTSANTYEVRDASNAAVSTGSYADGETIAVQGLEMKIIGAPATGDSFSIGPAGTRDIFSTISNLVSTLQTPTVTATDKAERHNALQSALRDVSTASDHLIDARAEGGAQLANLDKAASMREANTVTLKTTLSSLRDLDYAEAITEYQLQSTALQAAQSVFSKMQSMSLFSKI